MSLETQITGLLVELKIARQSDGKVTVTEAAGIVHMAMGITVYLLTLWEDDDGFDFLIGELEQLYETHIKPIDIKGLSNFIEPTVDGILQRKIRTILVAIREHIAEK